MYQYNRTQVSSALTLLKKTCSRVHCTKQSSMTVLLTCNCTIVYELPLRTTMLVVTQTNLDEFSSSSRAEGRRGQHANHSYRSLKIHGVIESGRIAARG